MCIHMNAHIQNHMAVFRKSLQKLHTHDVLLCGHSCALLCAGGKTMCTKGDPFCTLLMRYSCEEFWRGFQETKHTQSTSITITGLFQIQFSLIFILFSDPQL